MVQEMKQKVQEAGSERVGGLWFCAEKLFTNFNVQ